MRKIILFLVLVSALLLSSCTTSDSVSKNDSANQQGSEPAMPPDTISDGNPKTTVDDSNSSETQEPLVIVQPVIVTPPPSVTPPPVEPTNPTVDATTFAIHNDKSDCWVLFQNKVYDITDFLPRHPGGSFAISKFCGKTGFESAFQNKHGTSKLKTFMANTVYQGDFIE